jgi:hypothetical protein
MSDNFPGAAIFSGIPVLRGDFLVEVGGAAFLIKFFRNERGVVMR